MAGRVEKENGQGPGLAWLAEALPVPPGPLSSSCFDQILTSDIRPSRCSPSGITVRYQGSTSPDFQQCRMPNGQMYC